MQAYRRVLDAIKEESGLPEEAILDLRGALSHAKIASSWFLL